MTNENQSVKESSSQQSTSLDALQADMLHITSSPHLRHPETVTHIMVWVVVALIPSLVASVIFFGVKALILTAVAVTAAVITEWAITKLMKIPNTIGDFSAVVTGILVAFNVPSELPWWMVAIGSVFAVGVAKMAFGGLGSNFINPALAGRAFLMASYPSAMTRFAPTTFGSRIRDVESSGSTAG